MSGHVSPRCAERHGWLLRWLRRFCNRELKQPGLWLLPGRRFQEPTPKGLRGLHSFSVAHCVLQNLAATFESEPLASVRVPRLCPLRNRHFVKVNRNLAIAGEVVDGLISPERFCHFAVVRVVAVGVPGSVVNRLQQLSECELQSICFKRKVLQLAKLKGNVLDTKSEIDEG